MSKFSAHNVFKLLSIGLVFHVVFIASVFDCYFTSPVVHGMKEYNVGTALSKRVVLIVGDGLRADLLFGLNAFPSVDSSPEVVAPYLRSIAETRGAFGISHTRVPTESRPGHVAIIGGMYEDVSAVTKGWKTNPVDFDSIFNRSSYTFSFGSPDILPMFARGATPGKVKTWSYDEEAEDFTKDAIALDIWVLDQLRDLFHNASVTPSLNSEMREGQVVFFLHLLGLDTTGHSYRPHSKEYMRNIQVVDTIVRDTEKLFSDFFKDEETAFIFTADHGMSKIGNHGDGDPDNTRTPLIAWGRGIRGPIPDSTPSSHDDYSQPWHLNHLLRRDVEQADLTPLMASLLGINWPVNSVGVLPDVDPSLPGYLLPRDGDETIARAAFVNAQVILDQYRIKHEHKAEKTLFYKPFHPLEDLKNEISRQMSSVIKIERLLSQEKWREARQESVDLIRATLQGLRYLETYDRLLIRAIVIASYLGWAAYASLSIFPDHTAGNSGFTASGAVIDCTAAVILITFWAVFAIQQSPWTFYLYITFPCYFWQQFARRCVSLWRNHHRSQGSVSVLSMASLVRTLLVVANLQGMVMAYTHRSIWSFGFLIIGIVWPCYSWPSEMFSQNWKALGSWASTCMITAIFPLLSVDKEESLMTILIGGGIMLLAGIGYTFRLEDKKLQRSVWIQLLFILSSMVVTASSVINLQNKRGLPLLNQVSAWIILAAASVFPFISQSRHTNPTSKLVSLFLGFSVCFVVLSISVEGLFYVAYSWTLLLWIDVEAMLRGASPKSSPHTAEIYQFQVDDLRIALFFLFFVQVAFFGTGNVASISSFYLEPVYRLVPIFNPFLMASLLVFKIVVPYIILAAAFSMLNARLHLPPFSLFLVALTLTDGKSFELHWLLYDVVGLGSWLEIGQSISFFIITSLLLVWSAGICVAGEYLMADTLATIAYTNRIKEQ
ncbi:Phosphatidylinositolglycan class N-domain-containing protein [Hygrophoropsis aurantiaca]|uniref:Phosphatidylinositolglycan class N-domain-containing protein n=1 Tax=Hygrophoropsis aurantiaca TaxID=72124 RepID=A0ACB8AFQ9_9AGAM|nr:Phosphatidylinositolglycan class N-domain-containing protein [Hygrophoropsis aurantiaca]